MTQTDTISVHMTRMKNIFEQLLHHTCPLNRNLREMWFLATAMQELMCSLAETIAKERQTLKHFPTELLMMVVTFNADPSLRILRQTCKNWGRQFHQKKYAIQWTASVCQSNETRDNPFEEGEQINLPTLPLQECRWLYDPISLPILMRTGLNVLDTFTQSEGLQIFDKELIWHKIVNWGLTDSRVILTTEQVGTDQFFSIDLSAESLRMVVKDVSKQSRFIEIKRNLDGSFQSEKMVRGTITGNFQHNRHQSAWSPRSWFVFHSQVELTEYDFETCKEVRKRNIFDLFQIIPNNATYVYMGWYAHVLVLMTIIENVVDDDTESPDDPSRMELILLDWEHNTNVVMQREILQPLGGNVFEQLVFAFQLFEHPLVYLSLREKEHYAQNAIHFWGPRAQVCSHKRKR